MTAPPFSEEQLVWLQAVTGLPLVILMVSVEGPHASGETLPPCSTTPTMTVMPGEQDIRVLTIVGNCSPLPYCSTSSPLWRSGGHGGQGHAQASSLALLSFSVSMANLSSLLATTFSSLMFLFNSLPSPRFNLLRVARRCFSWFSQVGHGEDDSYCTAHVIPV